MKQEGYLKIDNERYYLPEIDAAFVSAAAVAFCKAMDRRKRRV